ncbi:MAG: DUF433 domain-containing protein, partial [Candidatus Hodarchaeota archaeon]
ASFEEIINAYPSITVEDIKAVLKYSGIFVENQKITGLT